MDKSSRNSRRTNIGPLERVLSVGVGAVVGVTALRRTGLGRALAGSAAGYLIYRGIRGHSRLYRMLGVSDSNVGATVGACSQVTVQAPLHETFAFLRDLENLPRFSTFIEQAELIFAGRWRLRASTPLGHELSWEVRVTADEEDSRLAWCAVEGAPLPSAAEVRLNRGPHGTEIHVDAWLTPPAADLVSPLVRRVEESRLLQRAGLTPSKLLQQELRRLRQLLETGEIATTKGQSSGRHERARSLAT